MTTMRLIAFLFLVSNASSSASASEASSSVNQFCGLCQWKRMPFDCDFRVKYLVENYDMTINGAQQLLMDDGDCIDADAAPAAMEVMTPPADDGIENANDEDDEQENSIAIDKGNEQQVDEQDVGPDESSDGSEREEADPDADGQQVGDAKNNVDKPSPSNGKQKQKDDPQLSLSQFCGNCLWRQSNLSCDQKAQVIANEYPTLTLEEAKVSILSGCMRNGDSEMNNANNASKSYEEKSSNSSTMIIPIITLVLALVILTIQARENKKLKEEILSLRDNNRELGGGNYSDNPHIEGGALVRGHGLEDMGKPSNVV